MAAVLSEAPNTSASRLSDWSTVTSLIVPAVPAGMPNGGGLPAHESVKTAAILPFALAILPFASAIRH
jgi:hypothetical protein